MSGKLFLSEMLMLTLLFFASVQAPTASFAAETGEQIKETLRPEVGQPLQAAQDLMKSQKYQEALAKIDEANAVAGKNSYEAYLVASMRGAAASAADNLDLAASAFDVVLASARLPSGEQLKIEQALAGSYYRKREYAKAIVWLNRYFKDGGVDPQMQVILSQSYYLAGDYAGAAHALQARLQADESAGRTPREEPLRMLASSYLKQDDNAGYAATLMRLVQYYPKKEYWADLINRVQRKPGFPERLTLDVYRLQQATGTLNRAEDYMAMAQLALQAGYSGESKMVLEQGFAAGVLGSGANAGEHRKLREQAVKKAAEDQKWTPDEKVLQAARDGTMATNAGFNDALNGKFDTGIALLEQGFAKGGMKHLEDAELHLGIAYYLAGRKARADQILKAIGDTEGVGDLAHLWALMPAK